MKPSTWRKIEEAIFWITFSLTSVCVIQNAIMGNWNSVLGWLCALLWMITNRKHEKKLRKAEIDLFICVSFMEKSGLLGSQPKKDGEK